MQHPYSSSRTYQSPPIMAAAAYTSLHALVRSSPLPCRARGQDPPGRRAASCLMAPTAGAPADHLVQGAAAKATVPAAAVAVAAAAAAACCRCEDGASLERTWRAVQGCNDWEGLVEPLHPLLRAELVRYGELVAACYKAFDVDPASKRYLKCRYGKGSMMREVGMGASGYTVTRYLYMTPAFGGVLSRRWAFHGRWIGYVAVASDRQARRLGRRDVVVTFRGTATAAEWAANLMISLTPARLDPGDDPRPDVKVEWGFLSMYTSDDGVDAGGCREQLISELSRILGKYEGEELSVTFAGHSMGGAMAILAGYDLAELGLNRSGRRGREVPVTVYSFGGPRVGNAGFKARCEELGVKVLRVVNVKDPITKMPGVFLNENLIRVLGRRHSLLPWSCCCSCYAHVGVEVALDFLEVKDLAGVHDLGTYLRLLRSPSALEEDDDDLLGKISRSWSKYRSFHASPWVNAAASVGNLVQSLGLV